MKKQASFHFNTLLIYLASDYFTNIYLHNHYIINKFKPFPRISNVVFLIIKCVINVTDIIAKEIHLLSKQFALRSPDGAGLDISNICLTAAP